MTKQVKEKGWLEFVAWCRARRLTALPAHPWTVAAYVRHAERRYRLPALKARVRAIARMHLLSYCAPPDTHPTVIRTLRLLEARERTRGHRASLFPADECAFAPTAAKPAPERKAPRRSKGNARAMPTKPRLVSRRPRSVS